MDKGIFLEYLDTSKAYKIFNTGTLVVEESIHVKFNDGLTPNRKLLDLEDYVANMQIGPFVTPKQDEVKQSDEILPQTEGLSNQQPQT